MGACGFSVEIGGLSDAEESDEGSSVMNPPPMEKKVRSSRTAPAAS